MIDLKKLDFEYNNYKNIRNLYIKYKREFKRFNQNNREKLKGLLTTYNSIKDIKRNSSRHNTTADELLEDFIEKNPLFGKWYKLNSNMKYYQNQLQQYFCTTQAFMECAKFICLKHQEDDGYDLLDLSTHDKLNLSQYDNDKQQYIINNLKIHHSFICYVTQEDLPLLRQVVKEIDKKIVYNDNDTEEEMEQKFWEEITSCHIIATEFEERKKLISLKGINNIQHEQKLIELLGYNLIGPDKSNRWIIVDENNNQVGFIQYKKLFNKNDKKGYPATFGYCTEIDSSKVSYKSTRKINNVKNRFSLDTQFSYELDIKRENGDTDHVDIHMDEFLPYLAVWSDQYGFISLKVDSRGLFFNFKSKTENFNVEESVLFQPKNKLGQKSNYVYKIKYCDKELELSDDNLEGTIIRQISGTYKGPNQLNVEEKTWINGKLRTDRESEVVGTVQEMAIKHQMGIDSFNWFRFLINQILPVKQDVVSAVINDKIVRKYGLSLFIPKLEMEDLEKEQKLVKRKENKSETNK